MPGHIMGAIATVAAPAVLSMIATPDPGGPASGMGAAHAATRSGGWAARAGMRKANTRKGEAMNRRTAATVLGALAVVLAGCGQEVPEDPSERAYRHLEKALTGLERPLRADVEAEVFVRSGAIPPIRMNAQMRGTQRSAPDQAATDLDLRSVTTTVEREYSPDLVRTGAVRVITVDGRTYVRNTLQSSKWRTLAGTTTVVGNRGLNPAGTEAMLRTTMVAAMFRSKGYLVGSPSPTTTAGAQLRRYYISCMVGECLKKAPDILDRARRVYPPDALIQLELFVDEQDRPRILEVESEFLVGNEDMTRAVNVLFRAKLTLHDHGKPQQITAPVH
ncbi:hypothetical protein [Thermoactinospora rubra]|uniref:hypothetical protein n=1 Tax=Thermoactinospora rubra TaxID=1088767 RepID=UPI00117FB2C0|nr:hypothetical protein [Thermoactinospora rubra]